MTSEALTVRSAVDLMKQACDRLAKPVPVEGMPPMTFGCSFAEGAATPKEVESLNRHIPASLGEFWSIARMARPFEDQEYGQWGLELIPPEESARATNRFRARRPRDFRKGDLIVGRFIGDLELLVVRCNPLAGDFGHVLVALPLDPRQEWYTAAESFAAFLDRYARAGGDKYWTEGSTEAP